MDRILGTPIRLLREALDLTQHELARRSGISQGGLSLIEDGARWPVRSTLVRLGQGLGVSPKVFFRFWAKYILKLTDKDWEGVTWKNLFTGLLLRKGDDSDDSNDRK